MNRQQQMGELRRAIQLFLKSLDPEERMDDIISCASAFPAYKVGVAYKAKDPQKGTPADIFRWGLTPLGDAQLYKVIQSHTSSAEWKPDEATSLYEKIGITNGYYDWSQPHGDYDAYEKGQRVYHNGQVWESDFDGLNVWEPGVFGWHIVNE